MKRRRSQSRPTMMSFSSLPYDIALNILARVPKIYHPILCLVSKSFQSILSSRELYATRSRIGTTEDCHYVCLNLNKIKPEPRWFIISPHPNQRKLIPIPRFPFPHHPMAPTVLSVGSEIYIIGGFLQRDRSKRVFLLDCQSHRWRRLPDMHVIRRHPAASSDVIDGKICVIGGNYDDVYWGEVYDPKTQTWEPLVSETALDLTIQRSKISRNLVMDGKVYSESGGKCRTRRKRCYLEIENGLYSIWIRHGKLLYAWGDQVLGLEELSSNQLFAVANSSSGRVTVWWKTVKGLPYTNTCKTKIWCAEISFEKRSSQEEIWGTVEWSNNVFTFDGSNANSDFFLHSAIVTH